MSDAPKRILVADDVKMLALRITGTLDAMGYETAIASNGEECLEMVDSFAPDLLILDIMMPKMHGIEVLRRLQSMDLGVIVCTGKDFRTDRLTVDVLGAVDMIIKPFEDVELAEKVDQYFSVADEDQVTLNMRAPVRSVSTEFKHELQSSVATCRLWGTRGSIPVSDPQFVRHGGNTSCMSIDCGEERLIFDAGSGIRPAGLTLMDEGPRHIHLFMTHTHWDHIQGFPFFGPVYVPGFKITVYAAAGFGKNLEGIFRGQLDKEYFPVQMDDMAAELEFKHLGAEPVRVGDAEVTWEFAQHPGATVGYRIQVPGTSISWIPDNEFLKGYQGSPIDVDPAGDLAVEYEPMIRFLTDIDVLIHECQYTHEEYAKKTGWGHSSIPNACLLAKLCNARRWVITHHDPMHNDVFLQNKLNLTRQMLDQLGHRIDVSHGFDGWTEHF